MKMRKALPIVALGLLFCGIAEAQTTTGTAQNIGGTWYYNFYTQPAPQVQVFRPLTYTQVDPFQYSREANAALLQSLQFQQTMKLQRQALELERQKFQFQVEQIRLQQQALRLEAERNRLVSEHINRSNDWKAVEFDTEKE